MVVETMVWLKLKKKVYSHIPRNRNDDSGCYTVVQHSYQSSKKASGYI